MLEPYAVKVARTVLRRIPPRERGALSDVRQAWRGAPWMARSIVRRKSIKK